MQHTRAWLPVAVMLVFSACAPGAGNQAPTPGAAAPTSPSPVPVASVLPGSSSSADPQPAVDAALRDASLHLSVALADLKVDQVQPRQWGDSSLGCPKPGLMYSQIVTPGFLILISGAGKQLEYHSDSRGQVVLCQER